MASTYSSLKIELIGTGDQAGTWGSTTNTNLGTALEEAITGSVDVAFSSADVTLTLTDTNATQTARNLRLNLTGTSGGARNLIVPAIEKQYIVNNGTADTVTIKNSTGTGVAIPTGATIIVFNNATNVVVASNYAPTFTAGQMNLQAQGPLRFEDAAGGQYVAFAAPATVASNVTWTLPSADGTNGQFLSTNGTGTLAWTSPTGGISTGKAIAMAMIFGF
jgi:hypothetical protein